MSGSSDEPSDPARPPLERSVTRDPRHGTAFTPSEQRENNTAPILLLSMPQMADPNFVRTVVLLCDYTDKGAFGLVVNRQMSEPAWTLVQTEPPVRIDPDLRLWIGGTLETHRTPVPIAAAPRPH